MVRRQAARLAFLALGVLVGACSGSTGGTMDATSGGDASRDALAATDAITSDVSHVDGASVCTPTPVTPITTAPVTASGAINGALLHTGYTAIHLVTPAPTPAYCPVQGLRSIATAEYSTGMLMDDGRILTMGANGVAPLGTVPAGTMFTDYQGGLHQSVAVDSTGHVWTWGANDSGVSGTGMDHGTLDPHLVPTDASGAEFANVVGVRGGYGYSGARKADGTLWIWGSGANGIAGDGTAGAVLSRPTQVHFPAGVHISDFLFSDMVMALDANGGVWTWGESTQNWGLASDLGRTGDATRPALVMGLPTNIASIANGTGSHFAVTSAGRVWAWGRFGGHTGIDIPASMSGQLQVPTDITDQMHFPAPVRSIVANDGTAHAILTDGSLWGWGDDAQGLVGDGQEIDFSVASPASHATWAWDWGFDLLYVAHPVRIAPNVSNFRAVYTNASFVFYVFAVTDDGYLYSWGRNKTADLMNGIIPAAPVYGGISAAYPNSWDVMAPALVNPLQLGSTVQITSPYCIQHPTVSPCTQYTGH